MGRTPMIDLDELDLSRVEIPIEEVRKLNPQRYEMEQIDGVLKYDPQEQLIVAYKDVRPDEHWARGHIPGRPLMPGVLMCECAAQTCSYYYLRNIQRGGFLGFGGMDGVRFRGQVQPGDKLIMVAKPIYVRPRMAKFQTQGIVNGNIVFEGTIIGVPM